MGPRSSRATARLALTLALAAPGCAREPGLLAFSLVDAASGDPTPARVELLDAEGEAYVPTSALPVVKECLAPPPPDWLGWVVRSQHIDNPHTGTRQFYADGGGEIRLPPGRYRLRAFKGTEYRVASAEVEVRAGARSDVALPLTRWIDLPAGGWYGADDHLHITRRSPADDAWIGRWLAAEGLHVANLLQMGTQKQFGVTPQYAFGDAGAHREGDTLVLAGQEHPRSHLLGHTIVLGAREPIDLRETYAVYEGFWREAARLGGVPGYAHWGAGAARDGLAIDAPGGLVSFVEVLQFEYPGYEVWYELLELGLRFVPTAGTDFPCGPWSVPGRERFYTEVEGPLSRESWLAGIRRGRTFVTNGPALAFRVEDAAIGDELVLERARPLRVEASARFDPAREAVKRLELLWNGRVAAFSERPSEPGLLRLETTLVVGKASWLAVRASGEKRGETPLRTSRIRDWLLPLERKLVAGADVLARRAYARTHPVRPSAAHTAPIWVALRGAPPLSQSPRARELARVWLTRLDALEARLSDEHIGEVPIWDRVPYSDGLSEEHLRDNRAALREAIARARAWYAARAAP